MKVYIEGAGPIATALRAALPVKYSEVAKPEEAERIVWCRGNDWEGCVVKLHAVLVRCATTPFVVVTSEHGAIPAPDDSYWIYQAARAAQKHLLRCFASIGGNYIDVSPAFVVDTDPDKRINTNVSYRGKVRAQSNESFPVVIADVVAAILFALEHTEKMDGTTIRVSAGWRP